MKPTNEDVVTEEAEPIAAPVDAAKQHILETEGVTTPLSPGAAPMSEQMLQLAAIMQENTLRAVAEMRKPSPEEQQKLDDARARRINNERQAAQQIQANERAIKAKQSYCAHALPNGKTAFRAQINSDGCYRPFCPLCHYISKPIRGDAFRMNNEPLNLHKLDASALTIPRLEAMAAASLPPLPVSALPSGAEVDLAAF